MAFIVSFDEAVVAMYLSSVSMTTLPKLMLDGIAFEINPVVAAVSSVFILMNVLAFAALGMLRWTGPG
jgi:ABC-type spermidine/putrescine transport system permease subunit II